MTLLVERKVNALIIEPHDSVAVAVEPLQTGSEALYKVNGEDRKITITADVPIYHKFAVVELKKGDEVYKYGEVIGRATRDIRVGEHVHTHNVASIRENIQH